MNLITLEKVGQDCKMTINEKANTFKYQATLRIDYDESELANIEHILKEDESFEEMVEVFTAQPEDYKIYVSLSCKNRTLTLQSLILEKTYLEEQNIKNFQDYAESKLLPFFNKLRLLYSSSPQDVAHTTAIKTPEGKSNVLASVTFDIGGASLKIHNVFDKFKYSALCKANNSRLDEYIDSYLAIKKFPDPEFSIISSYRLYELIGQDNSIKGRQYNASTGKSYYEDHTGKAILEIDYLAIAARNLVAHGSANSQNKSESKTVKALNDALGSPNETFHKFDRRNENQMQLIEKAAERLLSLIENYLKKLIKI
ncbi:hypothetical protein ACE1CD_35435 [Aerosakkonema sp. BLCC-F183]|uniref:hypothetical protein n=1 Tax=Aerosakkonema sp. BLCC-F183 TaxID=3342834 RepID=UPI0035B7598E